MHPRLLAFAGLLTAGCAMTPSRYKQPRLPPDTYFVASIEVQRETDAGSSADRVESLSRDASTVLRGGARVAFLPPDSCVDTSASQGVTATREFIGMRCGVLISELESQMARAGYEVVSWQALKAQGSGTNALGHAKNLGVDVVFEIDQLSADERVLGQTRATGLSLYSQTDARDRLPLEASRDVALRCKPLADRVIQLHNTRQPAATLSAKAVDVDSGRALWYYQKTRSQHGLDQRVASTDFYFPAEAQLGELGQPTPTFNGKQLGGNALVVTGMLGMVAGLSWLAVAGVDGSPMAAPAVAAGGGAAVAGIGGAMVSVGNREASEGVRYTGRLPIIKPTAEEVLCVGKSVEPPFLDRDEDAIFGPEPDRSAAPASSGSASSFTFEDSTGGESGSLGTQVVQQLFEDTVSDFIAELAALRGE